MHADPLSNVRPTWLRHAHEWDPDLDPATVDEGTILAPLLALNGERAGLVERKGERS